MEDYEPPAYYHMGEEVRLRGVSFAEEETRDGVEYMNVTYHIQFPESTRTMEVEQIKVEGGSSALYEDLRVRQMVPDWIQETRAPPWETEDSDERY